MRQRISQRKEGKIELIHPSLKKQPGTDKEQAGNRDVSYLQYQIHKVSTTSYDANALEKNQTRENYEKSIKRTIYES